MPSVRQRNLILIGIKANVANFHPNYLNTDSHEIKTYIHFAALRIVIHSGKRTKSARYVHL